MSPSLAPVFLALAVLGCYLTVRMARGGVFGQLLPILAIVIVSAAMGRTEMALGAAFGAAVATVGLVAPVMLLQQSRSQAAPSEEIGWWALLMPVVVVVLLVGMAATIDWQAGLLMLGLAAGMIPALWAKKAGWPVIWAAPAVLLALVVGFLASNGALMMAVRHPNAPAGLIAACVLGPMTCLPLLGSGVTRAASGELLDGLGDCIRHTAIVLLLAPLLTFAVTLARSAVVIESATVVHWQKPSLVSVHFPGTLWRIETILLLAISAMLIPISTGRMMPGRRDGVLMLLVYLAYLVASALMGLRVLG